MSMTFTNLSKKPNINFEYKNTYYNQQYFCTINILQQRTEFQKFQNSLKMCWNYILFGQNTQRTRSYTHIS